MEKRDLRQRQTRRRWWELVKGATRCKNDDDIARRSEEGSATTTATERETFFKF